MTKDRDKVERHDVVRVQDQDQIRIQLTNKQISEILFFQHLNLDIKAFWNRNTHDKP